MIDTHQQKLSPVHASLSFISPGATVAVHQHHSFQICISFKSRFNCTVGNDTLTDTWGFIVNQQVPHSCKANDTPILVNFLSAENTWGRALKNILAGRPFIEIESLVPRHAYASIIPPDYRQVPMAQLKKSIDSFLYLLISFGQDGTENGPDEKLAAVLAYIDNHLSGAIYLSDIGDLLNLSGERVRHWFLQQTGMPFSQYVIWKRIQAVVLGVGSGSITLARACIEFGFSDYPHFSRIFRRMFGVSPKAVFDYCLIVV